MTKVAHERDKGNNSNTRTLADVHMCLFVSGSVSVKRCNNCVRKRESGSVSQEA